MPVPRNDSRERNGSPTNETGASATNPAVVSARAFIHRMFESRGTRESFPRETVESLDMIGTRGHVAFAQLREYRDASIFSYEYARDRSKIADDELGAGEEVMRRIRASLDRARAEFRTKFKVSKSTKEKKERSSREIDIETTCCLSAAFAMAGIAVYGPRAIFEGNIEGTRKQLAERFADFATRQVIPLLEFEKLEGTLKPKHFHERCQEAFERFRAEFPELFESMCRTLMNSKGTFMAPFGDGNYDNGWVSIHYSGDRL